MKSNDAQVRLKTLEQARFDNEGDLKILQSALSSSFVSVRTALVYALSSTPAELALPILEKIAKSGADAPMRLSAVEAIGSFRHAGASLLQELAASSGDAVARAHPTFSKQSR
ncbi:HEAT repeat domain-containing protein [Candidatus Micrarchaeota archaeon]|nr:HEAT repeat domain-containing protein [Candidatus Micrarchaeota archaeon]